MEHSLLLYVLLSKYKDVEYMPSSMGISSKHSQYIPSTSSYNVQPLEEHYLEKKKSSNYNKIEKWGKYGSNTVPELHPQAFCRLNFSSVGKYMLPFFSLWWQTLLIITTLFPNEPRCCHSVLFKTVFWQPLPMNCG